MAPTSATTVVAKPVIASLPESQPKQAPPETEGRNNDPNNDFPVALVAPDPNQKSPNVESSNNDETSLSQVDASPKRRGKIPLTRSGFNFYPNH